MESGTWAWSENETILAITLYGSTENMELVSITGSTLKINVGTMDYDSNGDGVDDTEVIDHLYANG